METLTKKKKQKIQNVKNDDRLLHEIIIKQMKHEQRMSLVERNILNALNMTCVQPFKFSWKKFLINALTYLMIFMFGYFVGKLPDIVAWFCTIFS